MTNIPPKQDYYARRGFRKVNGWLGAESALIISCLSELQKQAGVRGVGEIGVHHGKLFILLHLSMAAGERSFAVDVFDRQDLNVDGSGHGDKQIFHANLIKFGGDPALVDLFEESSLNVSPRDILDRTGPIRLMSIDGGHTASITKNDLVIADKVLADGGIVILDDFFNHGWPDVSIGAVRFLIEEDTAFRPFAVSSYKLFFCNSDLAKVYREALVTWFRPYLDKQTIMFDSEVAIFGQSTWRILVKNSEFYRKAKTVPGVNQLITLSRQVIG